MPDRDDLLSQWRTVAAELDRVEAALEAARGPGPRYSRLIARERSLQRESERITAELAELQRAQAEAEAETEGSDDDD